MGFKLYSELSEKQIEADVATYLGWMTPEGSPPFRLIDINEQITGADKRFDLVIPFYLQFKVSHGLTKLTDNFFDYPNYFPFHLSPLNKIRAFRRRQALTDNPTLYFKLRSKSKTAEDFQHNMLMKFSMMHNSNAFYVAPLTLSKSEYNDMLYKSSIRFRSLPFYDYENEIHQINWISNIKGVPFLRGHISIVPHESVDTDNHHFSFSSVGTEIGWHSSPIVISNYQNRLSDVLFFQMRSAFLNGEERWNNIYGFFDDLERDKDLSFFTKNDYSNDMSQLDKLIAFGNSLYRNYEIRQILLVTTSEYLNKLNNYLK